MHLTSLPLPQILRARDPAGLRPLPSDLSGADLPIAALTGRHVRIETLIDGAAADLSFDPRGKLMLRAGGRPLAGGFGERPFIPMKIWAMAHEQRLLERLGDRYELHGVWSYSMRRVWYDRLPHYFHATEVLDRATGRCLTASRREALLAGSPVLSVPVLYAGPMPTQSQWLETLMRRPVARSAGWRRAFETAALREALPADLWQSRLGGDIRPAELLVTLEEAHGVVARFRLSAGDDAPADPRVPAAAKPTRAPLAPMGALLPNALAPGADLFAAEPTVTWRDVGVKSLRSLGALKAMAVEAAEQRCA
ncbi:RNA ligase family protein [Roseateles noduli]|uniref:RNA ligase family protein n=1 Tax=Roseateles noduli TaxID=2052484 RepID=UPI003D65DDA3